jgi:hypothetical protein
MLLVGQPQVALPVNGVPWTPLAESKRPKVSILPQNKSTVSAK